MTIRKVNGSVFSVTERGATRFVNLLDLDKNLQAVDPGCGWYVRSDDGYVPPDTGTYDMLEQVCHPIPRGLNEMQPKNGARVVPVENHETHRTNFLIRWPDNGASRLNNGVWETKWSDGGWVRVQKGSEHELVCEATFMESAYSRRRR